MADAGVYVYAIVRDLDDGDLRGQPGIGDAALRTVAHEHLRAVVSDVDLDEFGEEGLRRNLEDLSWLETVARAHDTVARQLAQQTATAPLRLATVFLTEEAVREQLAGWADAAGRALDRIQGRGEWSVKGFVDAAEQPAPAAPQETTGSGAGTAYLAARRAALSDRAHVAEERAELAAAIHAQLAGRAAAGRRLMPQDPALAKHSGEMILNGSYLVDDAAAAEFASAAKGLAEGHDGLRVEVAGPWPPYSFATLEEEQ